MFLSIPDSKVFVEQGYQRLKILISGIGSDAVIHNFNLRNDRTVFSYPAKIIQGKSTRQRFPSLKKQNEKCFYCTVKSASFTSLLFPPTNTLNAPGSEIKFTRLS